MGYLIATVVGGCSKVGSGLEDGAGDSDVDSDGDGDSDGDTDSDIDVDDIDTDFEECAAVTEVADNTYEPVDVIFVIDNSPSMADEIEEVRTNMNRFSQAVIEKGLNMNVVLISCLPGDCDKDHFHGICIDAPLGAAGGCPAGGPYNDTNLPQYLHLSDRVPSVKGLNWIISYYDQWKSMIREGATTHFVAVSDDNEEWSSAQFEQELLTRNPKFDRFFFHSIYSYLSKEDACALGRDEPCCTYAAPDGEGTVYRELVEKTGGVSGNLCAQDFDPIFDLFAESVIENAHLHCSWSLPSPPEGESLDPTKVNVEFVDGSGKKHLLGYVEEENSCSKVEHGWYYDNAANPSTVLTCPQTCDWVQDEPGATMNILFGCETESAEVI